MENPHLKHDTTDIEKSRIISSFSPDGIIAGCK